MMLDIHDLLYLAGAEMCDVEMDESESREYNLGILNQRIARRRQAVGNWAKNLLHFNTLLWRGDLERSQFPSGRRSRLEPI
jgi:hypothetical protein